MLQQQLIEFRSSYTRARTAASLTAGRIYLAGSASGNDIVLEGQDILERHVKLALSSGGLDLTPVGQSAVTVNGRPVAGTITLSNGDWLKLGACLFQIVLPNVADPSAPPGESAAASASEMLTIGRLPECDLQLPSPLVSREHARLYCGPGGVELEDLNSTNGTFVNHRRLAGRTRLAEGDRVAIASFLFVFTGETLEPDDKAGRVRIEARNLRKEVADNMTRQSRRLLDDVSLVIEPGEFVVIFGTSGSGKSTLLDALNGRRPASRGQVLYNGSPLYASFDAFRAAIGYVPQQDIVHRKITVRNALQYTARLRLPPDTSALEIQDYIAAVLDKVELAEKASLAIDTPAPLSGGQLKRVSLAVELVSNPTVLFLDEVTSGLDAGTDKRMMRLFASLAEDGKTVICVTHSLENIDVCHQMILLHKGKLVYFGPPRQAAGHFGVARLSEVYELLETRPAADWERQFRDSPLYKTHVLERLSPHAGEHSAAAGASSTPQKTESWPDFFRQTGTLMRRYLDLIVSDRKNLLILLLQAPLIALVIGLVFDIPQAPALKAAVESQIFLILVLSSIWFGTLNSARELVKELPIYLRERSVNLAIGPYLISKLAPLAVLCLLQCLLLLGIISGLLDMHGGFWWRTLALFAAGMAATCMGLAVSAFVDSNDKAIAMAPILLIPQVVLSNVMPRLGDVGLLVAKAGVISFWALDAMKTTLDESGRQALKLAGQPVLNGYGHDLARIALLGVIFLSIAVAGLKLKDRRR